MAAAAANKADVRRVVLTSSCAGELMAGVRAAAGHGCSRAVMPGLAQNVTCSSFRAPAIKGCKPAPPKEGSTYSEADWNETSTVGGPHPTCVPTAVLPLRLHCRSG